MREIKFRAMPRYTNMCQDELKEMTQYDGTFIYGHLIDNYIAGDVIEATDEYISLEYWVPIKKETVGQYTGLRDKNGKEIYEGDIVEVETISYTDCSKEKVESIWHHEGVMEFHQNGWCIVKKIDTGKSLKPLFFSNLKNDPDDPDTDIFEVVGNIFENPETLGDE